MRLGPWGRPTTTPVPVQMPQPPSPCCYNWLRRCWPWVCGAWLASPPDNPQATAHWQATAMPHDAMAQHYIGPNLHDCSSLFEFFPHTGTPGPCKPAAWGRAPWLGLAQDSQRSRSGGAARCSGTVAGQPANTVYTLIYLQYVGLQYISVYTPV